MSGYRLVVYYIDQACNDAAIWESEVREIPHESEVNKYPTRHKYKVLLSLAKFYWHLEMQVMYKCVLYWLKERKGSEVESQNKKLADGAGGGTFLHKIVWTKVFGNQSPCCQRKGEQSSTRKYYYTYYYIHTVLRLSSVAYSCFFMVPRYLLLMETNSWKSADDDPIIYVKTLPYLS
jgi:hypothetical protein